MSRSNWMSYTPVAVLILVASGLIAVTLYGHRMSAQRAYQSSLREYEKTKEAVPLGTSPTGTFTDPKSYQKEWRDEQEHNAQRMIVHWAAKTSVANWIGSLATCIGIWLLFLTLREAQRTTQAAINAAEAANGANEPMRSEQRAWIKIESLSISVSDRGIDLTANFSNKGRSTAHNISFRPIELPNLVARSLQPEILERYGIERQPNEPVTTIFPSDSGDDVRFFRHDQFSNLKGKDKFVIVIAAYYLSSGSNEYRKTCQGFDVYLAGARPHHWATRRIPHAILAT